jgi:hypothetical protein
MTVQTQGDPFDFTEEEIQEFSGLIPSVKAAIDKVSMYSH